ncbi:MAG: FemAB family PEP-CTERM system-associated protein [Planctomycetes bacterium]|nr:FemAB family PEP-CTERM system-associated protein [Planctomycetota bacterium]
MSGTTATTTTASKTACQAAAESNVTIRPACDRAARHAWARYVERAPGGTLFHHPDWCEPVQAVFGHQPVHRIALRDNEVVGILPLIEVRSILAGSLLVSVPYGTYGGILSDDQTARQALGLEAVRLADQRGARSLELRSANGGVERMATDKRYATFVRPLPLRVEELATYLPRQALAAVRQAQAREGLTVQHDTALLRIVWKLYARSMRRLASINYPCRFFESLVERLGRRAWVTVVWRDRRPVAGLLSFVFRDTVYPYFVGVDERVRCTGAANLVYFAVMERAVRAGLRRFDFGRSRKDNTGSFRFKKNQGFDPQTLGYQRYVPAGRTPPNLTPDNPRFSLARRVWPRLPLTLTRPLGAWLAKSIPG